MRPKYYSPLIHRPLSLSSFIFPKTTQALIQPPSSLSVVSPPHPVAAISSSTPPPAAATLRLPLVAGVAPSEKEREHRLSLSLCTHSSAPPAPPALRRAAFPLIAIAAIIVWMRRRGSHSHGDSTLGSGSANGHPAVAWCTRYRLHLGSWSLPWSPRGCPHGLAVAGGLRGSPRP